MSISGTPGIKIVTALVIFLCGLLSTVSPMYVAGNDALFSAGNMMAAGVLLAAGLCHQLADSSSSLDQDEGFPWSFAVCGFTFIMFLICEESVHLLLSGEHGHGSRDSIEMGLKGPKESLLGHHSCGGSIVIAGLEEILVASSMTEGGDDSYGSTHNHSHGHGHEHNLDEQKLMKLRRVSTKSISASLFERGRASTNSTHHHHDDHISEHLHGSLLAALMLLAALSIHSVLAGLSIGLVTDVSKIMSTAIAIVAHKVFAGYALGSTMVAADLGLERHLSLSIVFSLSTPLGILIGMGLSSGSYNEDSQSVGVVQAVVAGTFLYVAIMEVGMKELLICRHHDGPLEASMSEKQIEALKLFSMLLGYVAMSLLAAFV
jgi:zinc transporter 1/2/3